ncbi:hypothetical protein ACFW2I_35250 [Streptomyces nigra]|uniref:hypothetical protein n=1 Tax=Streptomyces nigra TaxID=1827580 RepID=UPI0036CB440F
MTGAGPHRRASASWARPASPGAPSWVRPATRSRAEASSSVHRAGLAATSGTDVPTAPADPTVQVVRNPLVNDPHGPWKPAARVAGKHTLTEKPSEPGLSRRGAHVGALDRAPLPLDADDTVETMPLVDTFYRATACRLGVGRRVTGSGRALRPTNDPTSVMPRSSLGPPA